MDNFIIINWMQICNILSNKLTKGKYMEEQTLTQGRLFIMIKITVILVQLLQIKWSILDRFLQMLRIISHPFKQILKNHFISLL